MTIDDAMADWVTKNRKDNDNDRTEQYHKTCLQTVFTPNVLTGKYTKSVWRCKDFRNCPNCKTMKIDEEANKLSMLKSDNLGFVRVESENEARKLVRSINPDEYLRYPQEGGEVILVMDCSYSEKTIPIQSQIQSFAAYAAIPPEGKRISGRMNQPEKQPSEPTDIPEEYTVEVNVPSFIVDSDKAALKPILQEIENLAIERIKHEKPDNVARMLDILIEVQQSEFDKTNIHYSVQYYYLKTCDIRRINWSGYSPYRQIASITDKTVPAKNGVVALDRTMSDKEMAEMNELLFD